MKKLVSVVEVEGEGFESLLGKEVTLFCNNYFYTGTLEGVNDTQVKLANPSIIYETGAWNTPEWKDAQKLPCTSIFVRIAAIEAYAEV